MSPYTSEGSTILGPNNFKANTIGDETARLVAEEMNRLASNDPARAFLAQMETLMGSLEVQRAEVNGKIDKLKSKMDAYRLILADIDAGIPATGGVVAKPVVSLAIHPIHGVQEGARIPWRDPRKDPHNTYDGPKVPIKAPDLMRLATRPLTPEVPKPPPAPPPPPPPSPAPPGDHVPGDEAKEPSITNRDRVRNRMQLMAPKVGDIFLMADKFETVTEKQIVKLICEEERNFAYRSRGKSLPVRIARTEPGRGGFVDLSQGAQ